MVQGPAGHPLLLRPDQALTERGLELVLVQQLWWVAGSEPDVEEQIVDRPPRADGGRGSDEVHVVAQQSPAMVVERPDLERFLREQIPDQKRSREQARPPRDGDRRSPGGLDLERDLQIGPIEEKLLFVLIHTVGWSTEDDLDDGGIGRTPPDRAQGALARPEQIEAVRQGS